MKLHLQLLTTALLTAAAGTAYADDCASDEDCPTGFACEEFAETCVDAPPCLPGEECPEPEPCGDSVSYECVPAPVACSDDSDCTDDWECFTFTYEECSGGGSTEPSPVPPEPGEEPDPGGDDAPDEPGDDRPDEDGPDDEWECETVSESYCAPPYIGECETDSDCGEGFTCVEIEECECGGSSGSGSSGSSGGVPEPVPSPEPDDPGSDDEEEPDHGEDDPDGSEDDGDREDDDWGDDCGCWGSGSYYCEPAEIECESDDECPADWTCESWGVSVSTPCWEDEDGEVICVDDPVEESHSRCEPPGWGAWGGAGGDFDDARGGVATSAAEESAEDPLPFAAAPSGGDAGCSTAAGGAGAASLFSLFGLLGFRRRR